jgi:hypothetical protein
MVDHRKIDIDGPFHCSTHHLVIHDRPSIIRDRHTSGVLQRSKIRELAPTRALGDRPDRIDGGTMGCIGLVPNQLSHSHLVIHRIGIWHTATRS